MSDDQIVGYGNALSQRSYEFYKKCDVIALPKKYGIKQMGSVIPKNSSFAPAFTYFIKQFIEKGDVDRIKQIYKPEDQICPTYKGKPLGLRKCITSFAILLIGGAISGIGFL